MPAQPARATAKANGKPTIEDLLLSLVDIEKDSLNEIRKITSPGAPRQKYYNELRVSKTTDYVDEKIFETLSQNAERIIVTNDEAETLYIKYSNNGINYSSESALYEGEVRIYANVHTLRIKTSKPGGTYRVAEQTLTIPSNKKRLAYALKSNEQHRSMAILMSSITSIAAFYKAPLPPTSTYHLVDEISGADMPFTIKPGYEYDILGYWLSFSQFTELNQYYSGILIANAFVEPNQWTFEHNIKEFVSAEFDPNHLGFTLDVTVTNRGSAALQGYGAIYGILRKI